MDLTTALTFEPADKAGWFLYDLRRDSVYEDWQDAGLLENLFSSERLKQCDESIFLKAKDGTVLALATISNANPEVSAYYTVPQHRNRGYGYAVLVAAIERIILRGPQKKIRIEAVTDESKRHIARLPKHLADRLEVLTES